MDKSQIHYATLKKSDSKSCPLKDFLILDERPEEMILWASEHSCIRMWYLELSSHLEIVRENPLRANLALRLAEQHSGKIIVLDDTIEAWDQLTLKRSLLWAR